MDEERRVPLESASADSTTLRAEVAAQTGRSQPKTIPVDDDTYDGVKAAAAAAGAADAGKAANTGRAPMGK